MSLHSDLLAQAQHLAQREPRRPKQASLRRAISAAYYALFHLLVHEESRLLVARPAALRQLLGRAFTHLEVNKASKSFAGGTLPKRFDLVTGGVPVPAELKEVAQAVVDSQQARHEADYNLAKSFSRSETQALINQAAQAFQNWQVIRNHDLARLYLTAILLWDRWDRMP